MPAERSAAGARIAAEASVTRTVLMQHPCQRRVRGPREVSCPSRCGGRLAAYTGAVDSSGCDDGWRRLVDTREELRAALDRLSQQPVPAPDLNDLNDPWQIVGENHWWNIDPKEDLAVTPELEWPDEVKRLALTEYEEKFAKYLTRLRLGPSSCAAAWS